MASLLTKEAILDLFICVDDDSIESLSYVCKTWADVGTSQELWRRRVFAHWPDLFSSPAVLNNLLKNSIGGKYLPIMVLDDKPDFSYHDIRIEWRDAFFLLKRVSAAAQAANAFLDIARGSGIKTPNLSFSVSLEPRFVENLFLWYCSIFRCFATGSAPLHLAFVFNMNVDFIDQLVAPFLLLSSELVLIASRSPLPDAESAMRDLVSADIKDMLGWITDTCVGACTEANLVSTLLAQCGRLVRCMDLNRLLIALDYIETLQLHAPIDNTPPISLEGPASRGFEIFIHSARLRTLELLDEEGWESMVKFQNAANNSNNAVPPPEDGPSLDRLLPKLTMTTIQIASAAPQQDKLLQIIQSTVDRIQRAGHSSHLPPWQIEAAVLSTFDISATPCGGVISSLLDLCAPLISAGFDSNHFYVNRVAGMAASDILRLFPEPTSHAASFIRGIVKCLHRNPGQEHVGFFLKSITNCISQLPPGEDSADDALNSLIEMSLVIVARRERDWSLALLPLAALGSVKRIGLYGTRCLNLLSETAKIITAPLIAPNNTNLSDGQMLSFDYDSPRPSDGSTRAGASRLLAAHCRVLTAIASTPEALLIGFEEFDQMRLLFSRAMLFHPCDSTVLRCYKYWGEKLEPHLRLYPTVALRSLIELLESPARWSDADLGDLTLSFMSGTKERYILLSDVQNRAQAFEAVHDMLNAESLSFSTTEYWARLITSVFRHVEFAASQPIIERACILFAALWNLFLLQSSPDNVFKSVCILLNTMQSMGSVVARKIPEVLAVLVDIMESTPVQPSDKMNDSLDLNGIGQYLLGPVMAILADVWPDVDQGGSLDDRMHVLRCSYQVGNLILTISKVAPFNWVSFLNANSRLWDFSRPGRTVPDLIICLWCQVSILVNMNTCGEKILGAEALKTLVEAFIKSLKHENDLVSVEASKAHKLVYEALGSEFVSAHFDAISEALLHDIENRKTWEFSHAVVDSVLFGGNVLILCPNGSKYFRCLLAEQLIAYLPHMIMGGYLGQLDSAIDILEQMLGNMDTILMDPKVKSIVVDSLNSVFQMEKASQEEGFESDDFGRVRHLLENISIGW